LFEPSIKEPFLTSNKPDAIHLPKSYVFKKTITYLGLILSQKSIKYLNWSEEPQPPAAALIKVKLLKSSSSL
jgi:hypothetical protein